MQTNCACTDENSMAYSILPLKDKLYTYEKSYFRYSFFNYCKSKH